MATMLNTLWKLILLSVSFFIRALNVYSVTANNNKLLYMESDCSANNNKLLNMESDSSANNNKLLYMRKTCLGNTLSFFCQKIYIQKFVLFQ